MAPDAVDGPLDGGSGDDLGEVRGEIKPVAYKLKAWVVEPGTRPLIWKEGVGLVPVELPDDVVTRITRAVEDDPSIEVVVDAHALRPP